MSSKKMSMNGSARNINENPGNYTRATSYGAAKYVKKIDYDKETGEILTSSSIAARISSTISSLSPLDILVSDSDNLLQLLVLSIQSSSLVSAKFHFWLERGLHVLDVVVQSGDSHYADQSGCCAAERNLFIEEKRSII